MRDKKYQVVTAVLLAAAMLMPGAEPVLAEGAGAAPASLELQPLIDEALKSNHDVWVTEAKWRASSARMFGLTHNPFELPSQQQAW